MDGLGMVGPSNISNDHCFRVTFDLSLELDSLAGEFRCKLLVFDRTTIHYFDICSRPKKRNCLDDRLLLDRGSCVALWVESGPGLQAPQKNIKKGKKEKKTKTFFWLFCMFVV
jgi:hypothetical protein